MSPRFPRRCRYRVAEPRHQTVIGLPPSCFGGSGLRQALLGGGVHSHNYPRRLETLMAGVTEERPRRLRDYPPLAFAALVMLVLLALMPSALNLPQTTPSETLEYAPVPPEDDQVNPPTGNFSSLGLGSSGSIGGSAPGGPQEE